MLSRTIRRWCLYLGITAALAAAMIAVIGAGTAQAASRGCISGYLCLWEPTGEVEVVHSGERRSFNPGVQVVEIDNAATNGWCDLVEVTGGGLFFSRIGEGEVQEGLDESILEVWPVKAGEVCPG